MKEGIHPLYQQIDVSCSCGAKRTIGSAYSQKKLSVEVCAVCHPYFTKKLSRLDTAGTVDKFMKKYQKFGQWSEHNKSKDGA